LVSIVLLAAFVVAAPYLSSALKRGSSFFSGVTTGASTETTTAGDANLTSTTITTASHCSSAATVQNLPSPDISNGSADVTYPADYCALASYALGLVNADRAANGTAPVALDYNQAAQQHADSMLYHGYFSHFDTQGYKPYMRYTLLRGSGADAENVAYFYYSGDHYTSTGAVEEPIATLEHSMVYNDSSCCGNGHRDNILNPLHNKVSIGVAYNSSYVYFDEEFESQYINFSLAETGASGSNLYHVSMTGVPDKRMPTPNSIYIAFDYTPTAKTVDQLSSGPHEYTPGTIVGGVLPKTGFFGGCGQFVSGVTVCADEWSVSTTSVSIGFSMNDFVKAYGRGVYTIYLITGSSTDSAITSISVFVP
jgi:uncharacterized protein YkwD